MNNLCVYCYASTDENMYLHYIRESARFLDRLPYSEELVRVFVDVIWAEGSWGDMAAAQRWSEMLERKAQAHHDLKGLILGRFYSTIMFHFRRGELKETLRRLLEDLDTIEKIGFRQALCDNLLFIGWMYEFLGDLHQAEKYGRRCLEVARRSGHRENVPNSNRNVATALFGRGLRSRGIRFLDKAERIYRHFDSSLQGYLLSRGLPSEESRARSGICAAVSAGNLLKVGRTYLALGEIAKGIAVLEQSMELCGEPTLDWQMVFLMGLGGLEEALGDPGTFRSACRKFLSRHPEASATAFQQWYLEPAAVKPVSEYELREQLGSSFLEEWFWQDPYADCSYSLNGALELKAANGRDIWHRNTGAPRFTRDIDGEFVAVAVCSAANPDRPAMGGLLIWIDPDNFLQIERGHMGAGQLSFRGRFQGNNLIVGRGMLKDRRIQLRLERSNNRFAALCSPDGSAWYSLGAAELPFNDSVEIGLFASSWIDRSFYLGAFPEGTAIRFESFRLWSQAKQPDR